MQDYQKLAIDQAWQWFELHANQRMQALNYFLVATAFVIAAFVNALDNHPDAAAGIALAGAAIAFFFMMLDVRNRDLVFVGEAALEKWQSYLAGQHAVDGERSPELEILRAAEPDSYVLRARLKNQPRIVKAIEKIRFCETHSKILPWLQILVILTFLALAVIAVLAGSSPDERVFVTLVPDSPR